MRATRHLIELPWLREALGNSPLLVTARNLAGTLASGGIAHLIVGGLAVQEHGYVRSTVDVDIVVPSVPEAREFLSIRGFMEVPNTTMIMKDRVTRVDVDFLPAGGSVGPHLIPLPQATQVSAEPVFIGLTGLVEQKISSYVSNKRERIRDLPDAVELIRRNSLPRELAVDEGVRPHYLSIWDEYVGT